MAKYSTLTELLSAIAVSIRGRTGKTATIVADNFPAEIDLIALLQESTIITDATSGDKTIEFTTSNINTEYRYEYASGITSLTLSTTLSLGDEDIAYYSIFFESGTTATVFTDNIGIYFTGNDCASGAFIPAASKTYEVGVWWDGSAWQGVIRGV